MACEYKVWAAVDSRHLLGPFLAPHHCIEHDIAVEDSYVDCGAYKSDPLGTA